MTTFVYVFAAINVVALIFNMWLMLYLMWCRLAEIRRWMMLNAILQKLCVDSIVHACVPLFKAWHGTMGEVEVKVKHYHLPPVFK